jgi:hypothetical protein
VSLLREIQDGATSEASLTTILRKTMVLAHRLSHQPLATWVERELDGYQDDANLPDYRTRPAVLKGYLGGYLGSAHPDIDIPRWAVPSEWQEAVFTLRFRDGVGHYEALLQAEGDALKFDRPSELAAMIKPFLEGYNCLYVWTPISRAQIAGMLDVVRNRVLAFALQVEDELPDAGEVRALSAGSEAVISQIFNTAIYGGQNVVGGIGELNQYQVEAGDFSSLAAALTAVGLSDQEIDALKMAIREDDGNFGPRTQSWLDRIVGMARAGTLAVAANSAGSLVADLLMRFFG